MKKILSVNLIVTMLFIFLSQPVMAIESEFSELRFDIKQIKSKDGDYKEKGTIKYKDFDVNFQRTIEKNGSVRVFMESKDGSVNNAYYNPNDEVLIVNGEKVKLEINKEFSTESNLVEFRNAKWSKKKLGTISIDFKKQVEEIEKVTAITGTVLVAFLALISGPAAFITAAKKTALKKSIKAILEKIGYALIVTTAGKYYANFVYKYDQYRTREKQDNNYGGKSYWYRNENHTLYAKQADGVLKKIKNIGDGGWFLADKPYLKLNEY